MSTSWGLSPGLLGFGPSRFRLWSAEALRFHGLGIYRALGFRGLGGGGVCSLNWVYFAAGTVYMEQNTTTSCEIDPVLVLLCVHGRN